MRIATWNIKRPAKNPGKRAERIRSELASIAADIWVLTETRLNFSPGSAYCAVHCKPHPNRGRNDDERWVSIWSRWPIRRTWEDEWSVSAYVASPVSDLVVHGLVLPYMHEPGSGFAKVAAWSRFDEELKRQREQWLRIRAEYPTTPLVLAGDFNQSLATARWYGSKRTRKTLLEAFEAAGVKCLTSDVLAESRKFGKRPLVDHIGVSEGLDSRGECVSWSGYSADGAELSDHPGVAVDLATGEGFRRTGSVEESIAEPHFGAV